MQRQAPRSPAVADRPLTICEIAFIEENLKAPDDLLGAAHRAGFAFHTRRSAELLRARPAVKAATARVVAKALVKLEITAERVLEEMARLALSDIRGLFDEQGHMVRPQDWNADVAAAVASFDLATTGAGEGEVLWVARVRLANKIKALELLAKYLLLLTGAAKAGKASKSLAAMTDEELAAHALALAVKCRNK